MKKLISAFLLLGGIFILIYLMPNRTIGPGQLSLGHAELADDCLACHTGFMGIAGEKCIKCHKTEEIGIKKTTGEPFQVELDLNFSHRQFPPESCVGCHTDHRGLKATFPGRKFSHEFLPESARSDCKSCHKLPVDRLHENLAVGSCADCHTTMKWSPANFDHSNLKEFGSGDKSCQSCHQGPNDMLHRDSIGSCSECHSTRRWKPSNYDHTKYFRFDRHHPERCTDCHQKESYKQYSCTGCHEHSDRKLEREHVEEGIADYRDCVRCHRSGDEDEAERNWRFIRRGEKSTGVRGDSGKREWDDDDDDEHDDD